MENYSIVEAVQTVLNEKIELWKDGGLSYEEIENKIESIDFDSLFQEITDNEANDYASFFKGRMFEIEFEDRVKTNEFLAHHDSIWGKCFAASQTMYTISVEAAEKLSSYINENATDKEKEEKKYTFLSLQCIHGRACQIFLEILTLLRNGFGDGAYARWRSLYELNCIAYFIKSQSEVIAKQYYDQSIKEDKDYNIKSYEWTNGAINESGKTIIIRSFASIEKLCKMGDIWSKQYKLSCLVTHGSPQGTFSRISNFKQTNEISVGRSD